MFGWSRVSTAKTISVLRAALSQSFWLWGAGFCGRSFWGLCLLVIQVAGSCRALSGIYRSSKETRGPTLQPRALGSLPAFQTFLRCVCCIVSMVFSLYEGRAGRKGATSSGLELEVWLYQACSGEVGNVLEGLWVLLGWQAVSVPSDQLGEDAAGRAARPPKVAAAGRRGLPLL